MINTTHKYRTLCLPLILLFLFTPQVVYSQSNKLPPTQDTVSYRKQGLNIAPLPAFSFDSDLRFGLGAILNLYWFGDGSTYPEYKHKITAEACFSLKGSGIFFIIYDSKYLIPGLRVTANATYLPNPLMGFYGFNGYPSPYLSDKNAGFYSIRRDQFRFVADLQGRIADNLNWAAGIGFYHYGTGRTTVEKYRNETTLYDLYVKYGIINADESRGGSNIELRTGIVYDTRDNEAAPSRGIHADALLYGSPDIINQQGYSYLKAAISFRHYVPLIHDRLTLAYRLNWQGMIAGRQPFYTLQNYTTLFPKQMNCDILGGATSLRGILYNRAVGNDMAWGNIEMRLKLFDFRLIGQEWYIATNPFFDIGMVTRPYQKKAITEVAHDTSIPQQIRNEIYSNDSERPHMSAGIGGQLVMNRNLVLSLEWGFALDRRDGDNGIYVNVNYIF